MTQDTISKFQKLADLPKSPEANKKIAEGFAQRQADREVEFDKTARSQRITEKWLNREYTI
jgi:hypothetical protein